MARLIANTLVVKPGLLEPVPLAAGDEVPEWAVDLVGSHLLEEPTPKPETEPKPDESWTVADLRDYAKAHDINLEGATAKADILAAIGG